ncbi:feruloyl esterase b precursor [Diplodia corticola]|uniref:Carboxylic ester hydrolase n=1 Tax=Diplodia corticola TaxID=236234 RepID=A0A1J9RHC9_9PEZI|nr:feruloyl esterase b precursor [Diplodia corticola]OJD31955.1 feruloyl esterase b precursor [Diplodia corticola]
MLSLPTSGLLLGSFFGAGIKGGVEDGADWPMCGAHPLPTPPTMRHPAVSGLLAGLGLSVLGDTASAAVTTCSPDAIATPELLGGQVLSITATSEKNSGGTPSFCNVTVQYTHPGQNDTLNVFVYLPASENWNERFMGYGGGGFRMRSNDTVLAEEVAKGYAVASTDGGHDWMLESSESWATVSPGNVNANLLNNFAAVALEDAALIGKAVTASFYGQEARYSYWSGCSTGGRQGLMLAQRFPGLYDGILATAPAINWAKFVPAEYLPQFIMNQLDVYPTSCELDAITAAAIEACDGLDGVEDGIIADPLSCKFDPLTVVGREYTCGESSSVISEGAATVVQKTWEGARTSSGNFTWYGLSPDASLAGLANTSCVGGDCTGAPFTVAEEWIKFFVKRGDPAFDITNMSHAEFDAIIHRSANQYKSVISTDDPDLSEFKASGGKMITWHGLADELIAPEGTVDYYEKVLGLDAAAADFYRFFKAPGVAHCYGGTGPVPTGALDSLVSWVEGGVAPETLPASVTAGNTTRTLNLCPYPLVAAYKGGDMMAASSYECKETFA